MKNDQLLSIHVTRLDSIAVLELRGEIDRSTAPRLQDSVERLCELGVRVVLDMELVTFMDSSGISALVVASGIANGIPRPVQIQRPSDRVRRLLGLTGLDELLLAEP